MKYALKQVSKILLLFIIPVITVFICLNIFTSNKWQKLPSLPQGKVVDILDVDIQPMGHIDELYAVNDQKSIFLWRRDPTKIGKNDLMTLIFLTLSNNGEWSPVATPSNNIKIIEIVSDKSFPAIGTYGKDSMGNLFMYDLESNSWSPVNKAELPPQKQHDCNPWPKLPLPEKSIAERFELCFMGALSEEWRYYIHDTEGSIWLWSKTISPFSFIPGFIMGLVTGVFFDLCLVLFWSRNKIAIAINIIKKKFSKP